MKKRARTGELKREEYLYIYYQDGKLQKGSTKMWRYKWKSEDRWAEERKKYLQIYYQGMKLKERYEEENESADDYFQKYGHE